MSSEENQRLALEFIEQIYNEGRLELIERYLSPDVLNPSETSGLEGVTASVSSLRETFSGLEIKIVDTISQGDRVSLRITGRGDTIRSLHGSLSYRKEDKFLGNDDH